MPFRMAFLHYNASLHFPKSGEFVFDDRADIVSDDITNRSWDGCNPDLFPCYRPTFTGRNAHHLSAVVTLGTIPLSLPVCGD
ncbi:hypothetical protein F6Y03_00860 [Bacillus megaterium]|nr:hypothetical protein [Priestia megaterium]